MDSFKQKITIKITYFAISIAAFAGNAALASEITEEKMLELTNKARTEYGLPSLSVDSKLQEAARNKAKDMFDNQYFEHISPQGVTPWYWFDKAGYDYLYAAENLALDFSTAEGVHSALMKSTGHRENILGANYKEIGVAVLSGNFQGRQSIIVVEEFGTENEPELAAIKNPFFEDYGRTATVGDSAERKISDVADVEIQVKNQTEVPKDDYPAEEKENFKRSVEDNSVNVYGKIIPQAYSMRNIGTLKKVYVEDIYWQKDNGNNSDDFIIAGRAKLKDIFKGFLNGLTGVLVGF